MCHFINRTSCFTSLIFIIWFHTGRLKKCIILYYRPNQRLCLQSASFCNLTSFLRLRRKIKNINNISLKFIMLTDNNQISKNSVVIIYCHLTKVSSQINKCIIFEPNEQSITLSTQQLNPVPKTVHFMDYLNFEALLFLWSICSNLCNFALVIRLLIQNWPNLH